MTGKFLFSIVLLVLTAASSCKEPEDDKKPDTVEERMVDAIPEFYAPNKESLYGQIPPEMTEIANESAGLNFPNDLEFHPFADRENELWVLCPGSDQTGGHTVTFFDPLTDPDNYEWRRDGNAWHFMALSTGLAFGENGNWATSQGIPDANRMGMFFTGPSLWSSDMAIYARVGERPTSQVNGSHLDMIHQSPMGMGIAHEIDNIYWVFDGFHSTLCRYDFAEPHYPGGYDHSDGKVWRFSEPVVKMSGNTSIPSHMVLDKETGILYICDTGNKRVIKVDIGSARARLGTPGVNLLHGEPLALYQEMVGATWEVVSDQGFDSPSGIALIANRLFVSDFNTGAIHCLDKSSHEKLGSYDSKTPGIAGLEVGPDGKLWFVNALENKLLRLDPAPVVLP